MTRRRRAAFLLPILFAGAAAWVLLGGGEVELFEEAEQGPGYRVVYRVEDTTTDDVQVRTEVLEVARPYSGRVESRSGEPPGDEVVTGRVTNRRHLWALEAGGEVRFGVVRAPAGPARDASYRALADAAAADLAEVVGEETIMDVACTVFAFADPVPQPLAPPTEDSRITSCVSADGIVLRETWTFDGTLARTVEAVELERSPPADERFLAGRDPEADEVSQPEAADLLGTQFVAEDDAEPGPLALGLEAPDGYERDRSAVVAQQIQGSAPSQTLVEAYVRGSELALVERSTRVALDPNWAEDEGEVIDVGPLGEGRIVYFIDRVEVRLLGDFGYARVTAPSRATAMSFVDGLSADG